MPHVRILVVVWAVVCCAAVHAQYFHRFGTKDGLAGGPVHALAKDQQGFLWVATTEVLQRYDGDRFQDARSFSVPGDRVPSEVRSISVAPDGTVWTSSELDGVMWFDPRTGRFHRWLDAMGIAEQEHWGWCGPVVWAGPDSAYVAYGRTGMVLMLPKERRQVVLGEWKGRKGALPRAMLLDRSGGFFWLATHEGLFRWRRDSGVFLPQEVLANSLGPTGHFAPNDLLQDAEGSLWCTAWGDGLVRYAPATGRTNVFLADSVHPEPVENIFRGLVLGADGHIKAGAQEGLFDLDPRNGSSRIVRHDPGNEHSIPAGEVLELMLDDHGILWIGTVNGLCKLDPAQNVFTTVNVENKVFEGAPFPFLHGIAEWKGKFLIATTNGDGLLRLDPGTGAIERFPFMEHGRNGRPVELLDFVPLDDGSLLVLGFDSGPFVLDPDRMTLKLFDTGGADWSGRWHGLANARDAAGNLWTSRSYKGAMRIDLARRTITRFDEQAPQPRALLDDHWVQGIAPDPRGHVWLSEYTAGIARWEPGADRLVHYDRAGIGAGSAMAIWDLALDPFGRLWLGTRGAGAIVVPSDDPTQHNARSLLGHEGLPALVSSVAADPGNEHMWLAGPKGLYRVRLDDLGVEHFGPDDGLSEVSLHHADLRFHASGHATFCDYRWLTYFRPDRLTGMRPTPSVHINGIELLGHPVARERWNSALMVPSDSDHVSIAFSAVSIGAHEDLRTEYSFESGGGGPWQASGPHGVAVLRRPAPGRWSFRVRIAGMPETEQRVEILVQPVWWNTWWARSGAFALVLLLGVLFYRARVRRVRESERMKGSFERQLAEVEMSALRAQMNPHFLFNSLNSINRYIVKNEPKLASEYLTKFSRLMRLVLNNSKQQVVPLQDELDALNLYIELESLRFNNRFELDSRVELDADATTVMVPPMLLQPYVENAIWHGLMHKKDGVPKLKLHVLKRNGELRFEVEDNGVGREHSALLRSKRATDQPSHGTRITRERLELVERMHGLKTAVHYTDLKDLGHRAAGTRVTITITNEE